MKLNKFLMEDLIRLTTLVASCDHIKPKAIKAARHKCRRLISLVCFVCYLIEIPDKLAKNDSLTYKKLVCPIAECEPKVENIRRIAHSIPRFDFIVAHLERTILDLKTFNLALYEYDLILLLVSIFVAYEWLRTEPLSVFSIAKLDSRAAAVIYEAMQLTLHGIKDGVLNLNDLQTLTSVVTNSTDLRRASAVN
ncbi:hypothetical protein EB796_001443 [Bugula neritina]|uniref:Uncharacterized protein n=1 Tax=Bugula neritina TaxID=10212 RepID=A0A7J7KPW5_BUGNE|nr:hypothetical protein EB796_001443 [Bugula neritina]